MQRRQAPKVIFPDVFITGDCIYTFSINEKNKLGCLKIAMPKIAQDFIKVFDSLCKMHNIRLLLSEWEFKISIPDEILLKLIWIKLGNYLIQAVPNAINK